MNSQNQGMTFTFFLKKGFYLLAFFAIFLTFLTVSGSMQTGALAAWSGVVISFVNFIFGTAVIAWGSNKPDRQFYATFVGGMFVRFAAIFILLFILIKYLKFAQIPLTVSLMISYVSFLILEIWIIYQESFKKGQSE